MRFDRVERYERFVWTRRMQALAVARPERQAQKLRKALPLLADQIEAQGEVDLVDEELARQCHRDRCEQRMRALYARVWREARRDYFAATPAQRQAIREHWARWRASATCMYFRYVVDVHTGVMDARAAKMRESDAAIRAEVLRGQRAQTCLNFEGEP